MKIRSVTCICFSPTGTTKAIAETIARGLKPQQVFMEDCTCRTRRANIKKSPDTDLVILASPVYYGRLPEEIVPFFRSLAADKLPVVPVVVYGNREYEDALLELSDIATESGFIPVAGGAFIAEHSYSNEKRPIAAARPDSEDLAAANNLGEKIKEKINDFSTTTIEEMEKLSFPGNHPYIVPKNLEMLKQVRQMIPFTPETAKNLCSSCGTCASVCPTGAINPDDVSVIDKWECMLCFACVKSCPENAKQMTDPNFNAAIDQLQQSCQQRKEPEIFL